MSIIGYKTFKMDFANKSCAETDFDYSDSSALSKFQVFASDSTLETEN